MRDDTGRGSDLPSSPLVGGESIDLPDALSAAKAAAELKRRRSQRLGTLLVLVVVGLYVGSGVMIQVLFDEMEYEKPFFFSFVSVGLCSTYLLQAAALECRRWLMPAQHAYSKVLPQPTAQGGAVGNPLQLLRPAMLLAPSYFCLNYTYFFSLDLTSVSSTMILSASTGAPPPRRALARPGSALARRSPHACSVRRVRHVRRVRPPLTAAHHRTTAAHRHRARQVCGRSSSRVCSSARPSHGSSSSPCASASSACPSSSSRHMAARRARWRLSPPRPPHLRILGVARRLGRPRPRHPRRRRPTRRTLRASPGTCLL